MNRKQFIESQGATCVNWTWSWSFINEPQKTIIFGAWDTQEKGQRSMIFSEAWKTNIKGHKQKAYGQSLKHIQLLLEKEYQLKTFKMYYSGELKDENGLGPAKIDSFDCVLEDKILIQDGVDYYACNKHDVNDIPEEIISPQEYWEGASSQISINSYERNPEARQKCLDKYGYTCQVCDFDFEERYGELGKHYIHVHHLKQLSEIGRAYIIDPINDLRPVCPNCHAMIHRGNKTRSLNEIKTSIIN